MAGSFNNKFFRVYAIATDKYGIDPLGDKIIPLLAQIDTYSIHQVTQDEKGAPDLISLREYGSEDYWWHIMAYNGIALYSSIVQGISLRIPDFGALVQITNQVVTTNSAAANSSNGNIAVI